MAIQRTHIHYLLDVGRPGYGRGSELAQLDIASVAPHLSDLLLHTP